MKRWMTIEYRKCRKDLNFEVNFRVNDVISTTVTKCSARIRRVRIAVCDAFLPSCESIFKMVRSMQIIL